MTALCLTGYLQRPKTANRVWRLLAWPAWDSKRPFPALDEIFNDEWENVATGMFVVYHGSKGLVLAHPIRLDSVAIGLKRAWPRRVEWVEPKGNVS